MSQLLQPRRWSTSTLTCRALRWWTRQPDTHRALIGGYYLNHRPTQPMVRWLICQGRPMYQGLRQPVGRHKRLCWINSFAWRYVMSDQSDDYAYAEGFAIRPDAPGVYIRELHAWNLRGGNVYDRTYGHNLTTGYLGVVFSDEFLRFTTFMTGHGFGLLNHFDQLWPYLDNYAREWNADVKRPR